MGSNATDRKSISASHDIETSIGCIETRAEDRIPSFRTSGLKGSPARAGPGRQTWGNGKVPVETKG
jgi:hypothetical protein